MAEVELPQLGESVTEAVITAWLVEVGDTVEVDQPLLEISTDKVDTEIPSPVAGTLSERKAEVDDTINVGDVIAVITTDDTATDDNATDGGDGDGEPDPPRDPTDDKPDDTTDETDDADTTDAATTERRGPQTTRAARTEEQDADVIVLGGGTGGYSTALRAAQLGLDVVLIERGKVGGTCLHRGCIPTKAILQSAEVAEHAQHAGEYGVEVDYHGIEVAALNAHKDQVVDRMYKGLLGALEHRGVRTVHGVGRLTDGHTVEVRTDDGEETLRAAAIVVATGSEPRELGFAPFDHERVISSDDALDLEQLPASAVILGAGAIGMEFASAWSAFGVEVTVIELEDRVLPLEDASSSKELQRAFRKQGITTLTAAKLTDVATDADGVRCTVETSKDTEELEADLLLVAVGRRPVTEGAGLEDAGVRLDDRGFVIVDEYGRTSLDSVWAVGDVIPTLGLAHASFQEGYLVADQLGGLDVLPIDYRGVPRVTYSHPEVASVGYGEAEAEAAGFEVVTVSYPFQALGRAAMMKATGTVKLIAQRDDDAEGGAGRLLGIHIVGPRATDLIAEGQLIYNWEALPTDVSQLIHAHPSLSEAIGEAHLALAGRALHG